MPSLKDVSTKIVGVKKTSQITKAMNMVSAAKLRGAQQKMENFHPYAEKFNKTMANLSGGASGDYPLMEVRDVQAVEIVVVTSDRGLCGSFNSNIIRMAEKLAAKYEADGKKVSYVCIGKKGSITSARPVRCERITGTSWVPSRCSMPGRSPRTSRPISRPARLMK